MVWDKQLLKTFRIRTSWIRHYCNQQQKNEQVSSDEPSVLKHALEDLDFKTLFEVARVSENRGIGEKFYLERWRRKGDFDSYWIVTRFQRDHKGDPFKVFGYYHYKGIVVVPFS